MGFLKVFIENNSTKKQEDSQKKTSVRWGLIPIRTLDIFIPYILYTLLYILFEDSYLLFLIIYMYIYAVFSENYSLITFLVVVLSSIVIRK